MATKITFLKITEKESMIINRACKFYKIHNPKTRADNNRSEFYKLLMLYLMKQHKISFNAQITWTADFYTCLENVYKMGVYWTDEGRAGTIPFTVKVDDSLKNAIEELRKKIGVKSYISILRCFLVRLDEYLNKVGA